MESSAPLKLSQRASTRVTSVRTDATSARGLADLLLAFAFTGDLLAAVTGLVVGFWIRFRTDWVPFGVELPREIFFRDYAGLITIGAGFLIFTFAFLRLYDARNLLRYRRIVLIIAKGTLFWFCAYLGISLALKFNPPISRIYVALSFVATVTALLAWRWAFHRILRLEAIASRLRQRIVFVGWNEEANSLVRAIEQDRSHPYDIVGCFPSPLGQMQSIPPAHVDRLGDYEEVPRFLSERLADIVILADLDPDTKQIISLSNICERHFVQFKVIPSYFQILASCLQLDTISGVPIMGNSELALERPVNRLLKRSVDILGSIFGLLIFSPLIAACSALIYLESPGSVFFAQERIGRNGRKFKMYKLRSMKLGAELVDHLNQSTLRADPRVLRIGAFMRRWNLDELPQFWNVLVGDMSLVGPRPERTYHSEKLSEEIPHYNARYSTKPGITGWAQINGLRGDTSLVERVRYDLFYLENWSLFLDLQIMLQTFFKRDNAY